MTRRIDIDLDENLGNNIFVETAEENVEKLFYGSKAKNSNKSTESVLTKFTRTISQNERLNVKPHRQHVSQQFCARYV